MGAWQNEPKGPLTVRLLPASGLKKLTVRTKEYGNVPNARSGDPRYIIDLVKRVVRVIIEPLNTLNALALLTKR